MILINKKLITGGNTKITNYHNIWSLNLKNSILIIQFAHISFASDCWKNYYAKSHFPHFIINLSNIFHMDFTQFVYYLILSNL